MTPEGATLRAVLDYLALCGIFAFRNNNAPVPRRAKVGGKWVLKGFRKSATPGLPDIMGIARRSTFKNGEGFVVLEGVVVALLPLACEVKSAKGRQSPAQREFQRKWEKAGGIYLLVRSVDELRTGLREAGVEVK